jgi:hypothetical protein
VRLYDKKLPPSTVLCPGISRFWTNQTPINKPESLSPFNGLQQYQNYQHMKYHGPTRAAFLLTSPRDFASYIDTPVSVSCPPVGESSVRRPTIYHACSTRLGVFILCLTHKQKANRYIIIARNIRWWKKAMIRSKYIHTTVLSPTRTDYCITVRRGSS